MSEHETGSKISLVIDVKQRRPACVLIQAAYGCRTGLVQSLFKAETWLTFPTDDMRIVTGTLDEWRRFASETCLSLASQTQTGGE